MQHATIQRVSSTIRSGAGQHTTSIITPASFLCHPFASLLSSSLSTPAPSYTNNLKHSLYTLAITMTDEYFPDSDSELTPQSESESEGSDCTDNGDGTNLGNGGVQAGNGGDDGGDGSSPGGGVVNINVHEKGLVESVRVESERVIDLRGQTVLPGFVDAHVHCTHLFLSCFFI